MDHDLFSGALRASQRFFNAFLAKVTSGEVPENEFQDFYLDYLNFFQHLQFLDVIWQRLCGDRKEFGPAFAAMLNPSSDVRATHEATGSIFARSRLDIASLFIFGKILLDKWARLFAKGLYVHGTRRVDFHTFTALHGSLATASFPMESRWPVFLGDHLGDMKRLAEVWVFLRDEFLVHGSNKLYPTIHIQPEPPFKVSLMWEKVGLSEEERRRLRELRDAIAVHSSPIKSVREDRDILACLPEERQRVPDRALQERIGNLLKELGTRSPDLDDTATHLALFLEKSLAYVQAAI